jgi:hypothetical protein
MSLRAWLALGLVWVSSLFAVGAAVSAQSRELRTLPEPRVLSGPDLGFRVVALHGETPTGHIVIRVNGEWVEARVGQPGFAR